MAVGQVQGACSRLLLPLADPWPGGQCPGSPHVAWGERLSAWSEGDSQNSLCYLVLVSFFNAIHLI